MARFLGETIESVLAQEYPRLEYLVVDGGSTDGTVDLLRQYEGRIRWISEPDKGQADAVNKGFGMCSGEIFTFLNADDILFPGAIRAAVRAFQQNPDAGVVYGDAWYTGEDGRILKGYPVEKYSYERLGHFCLVCQPASFLRAKVFAEVGMLDPGLHLTLDYDLWLRIAKRHPLVKVNQYLATSRMYADNKTLSRQVETFREVIQITKQHRGYVPLNWLYGYAGHMLDGKDNFFEVSQPSLTKYLLTMGLGLWHNPLRPHRFLGEAFGNAGLAARMLWNRWRGRPHVVPASQ